MLLALALLASFGAAALGRPIEGAIHARTTSYSSFRVFPGVGSEAKAGVLGRTGSVVRQLADEALDVADVSRATEAKGLAFPLRDVSALDARAERVEQVATARVLHADYDLLRADFEQLHPLSDAEIDARLLMQTAYVSESQARQVVVNTAIETTGQARVAYRPRHYGRGLVFPFQGGGLIDGVGFGVRPSRTPKPGAHGDGLLDLVDAFRRWQFADLVQQVLRNDQAPYDVIRPYAILDFGFHGKFGFRDGQRVGAYLRQAHVRTRREVKPGRFAFMWEDDLGIDVERRLRRYGVTTTGANRQRVDYVRDNRAVLNVQGDSSHRHLVDFSSYRVLNDRFDEREITGLGNDTVLAHEADPDMIPDESVRIGTEKYFGHGDSAFDQPFRDAQALSHAINQGYAGREHVAEHLAASREWVRQSLGRAD